MKSKVMVLCLAIIAAMVLSGCSEDKRYSSIYTTDQQLSGDVVLSPDALEVDLVEDLSAKRASYVESLKKLQSYYEQSGNFRKSEWARRELELFGQSPQYQYITVGQVASENLTAAESIPAADELYTQAERLYSSARVLALVGDKPKLRQALSMFNELISQYPTSDKIDDAAYRAGIIYQAFGDDKLAATYYQRAFQWDSQTPYPARFKAAYLMDQKLGMKTQALELYQYSVENEGNYGANVEFAQARIKALLNTQEVRDARKQISN